MENRSFQLIREYQESDIAQLRRMHAAMGLDYELPSPDDPLVLTKLVVEDERGKVMMAALLRLTAEAYLLVDHSADNPEGRWCALQALHESMCVQAYRAGLKDVQALVPPRVARHFRKRLVKLAWVRHSWESWTRSTLPTTWPEA